MDDLDWKKPALIGGLITGILSVLPFVGSLNICLCLWAWVGGIVAAKLLIDRTPRIVTSKDGAKIGLIAGSIAGLIVLLITMPLMILQLDQAIQEMPGMMRGSPEAQEFLERIQNNPVFKILFSFVTSFLISVLTLGFTVLGGLLGVALFEKRRNQPPPQNPPGYSPQYFPQNPAQYPAQYPQAPPPSADYPPQTPLESAPPQSDPPQSDPPQSGGWSGDQGGQDQSGQSGQSDQSGQSGWPKE